ncbi:MAG: Maf family protein [Bacillota bacterium]
MRRLILASGSPRRQELLQSVGADFVVDPSQCSEEIEGKMHPADFVKVLALRKAEDVAARYSEGLVIGADTIVVLDDEVMGKPRDEADARRMLIRLSGHTHQVYTGVAVIDASTLDKQVTTECTHVTMRGISLDEVERYIATGEPMDKAGAYAIQGKACLFITGIDGCYFNVVGLPLQSLNALLRAFGADLL